MDSVKKSLQLSRVELLDMGLRGNSLLHFRHGAKTLEIVDEHAAQVFDLLAEQKKPMTFLPVPDAMLQEDDEEDTTTPPLPELLEQLYGDKRHADNKLQTRLSPDNLDKRLLKISTEASTYYQEQGVDILYLALGFLTWYEDKNSTKPRTAPLVLVPVALERSSAKERFKISYTEADLGQNLSLDAKLNMEFQLQLPDFDEALNFTAYLQAVRETISQQPRWLVDENTVGLGFFSFGKFQMYQDLDSDNWPEGKKPEQQPLMQRLMGGGFTDDKATLDAAEQETVQLTELHLVKDSDSSQTAAVMAVKRGVNLVIQGPPGTGKSQTITNIIGEAISDNKTVLFVAEKMAALEVVKRRLDESHLGDAVLELHSHKSNKKIVLDELQRTLMQGAPQSPDRDAHKARHQALQILLDSYSEAVNSPILNTQTTYVEALGRHLNIKQTAGEHALPDLGFDWMHHWSEGEFTHTCNQVSELIAHLKAMGIPAQSPFSTVTLDAFSPVAQNQLLSGFAQAQTLAARCGEISHALAETMQLQPPADLKQAKMIHRAAKRAISAPHLSGLTLTTDDWQQRRDQINSLIQAGMAITRIKQQRATQVIDQAWQADLLAVRQAYVTKGDKWWRLVSSDYRRAKSQLQGLLKDTLPETPAERLALVDDILKVQTDTQGYNRHAALGERLFGAQWQGLESDWPVLESLSQWVITLYESVGKGELPEALIRFLQGDHALASEEAALDELGQCTDALEAALSKLQDQLQLTQAADNTPLADLPLPDLQTRLRQWHDEIDALYQMARFNRLRQTLGENDLKTIATLAYDWSLAPELLLVAFQLTWYEGLVNTAYSQHDVIKQFDRISHEGAIEEFRQLDSELFHHAQESLVNQLHARMPNPNAQGEVAIIRKEMNKKRRHMPLRRLIREAGRAIQQMKPVFMMSPMSVATYLEQGAAEFDLVVFDEASQVKVVDALGAILRGKQVVVVGDTKQMPPTDFFGKAIELDDEDAALSHTADIESILSMFLSQGAPESMLRWHYRSRHDSLITVSNQEFYDNKLMIFPSPGVNPEAKGLGFHHNPEAVYERGTSRTNPIEARDVATAVMQHAKSSPSLTLGVVAFSTAQRDCILLELERMRREDDSCEPFFNSGSLEGFFVKNLENVQGDERDRILISIGYGRTQAGTVSKSFGPLNREGGHRRLNVLITRARLAMDVFCNFTAEDLATNDSSPFGLRALKSFLQYAQSGSLPNHRETGKETDSPFEDEVISAIRHLGFDVEPQLGSAGFFIDIAVRDPEKPGRYILAVECDGASYHSSASARDRDRLRQGVLEGLGWRFHRIWSTDWFRNPHKETERLKASIEQAISHYQTLDTEGTIAPKKPSAPASAPVIARTEAETDIPPSANAYQLAPSELGLSRGTELHAQNPALVCNALATVVETEGAVHIKEAARRLAESMNLTRVGARIMNHIEDAAALGHRTGRFYLEDAFLYPDANKEATVRDRSALPTALRKIEWVCQEEIIQAFITVVEMAFSLTRDDTISEALSLMGFKRSTEKTKMLLSTILDQLVAEDVLNEEAGLLSVAITAEPA